MNGGNRGETRSSALWGTGNRGGESRSNALWGKGGRGALTALAAMLAISVPLASSAGSTDRRAHQASAKKTWISPGLLRGANRHPEKLVRVIIQSTSGSVANAKRTRVAVPKRVWDIPCRKRQHPATSRDCVEASG